MLDGNVNTLSQLLGEGLVYTHSTGPSDMKATSLEGVEASGRQ